MDLRIVTVKVLNSCKVFRVVAKLFFEDFVQKGFCSNPLLIFACVFFEEADMEKRRNLRDVYEEYEKRDDKVIVIDGENYFRIIQKDRYVCLVKMD